MRELVDARREPAHSGGGPIGKAGADIAGQEQPVRRRLARADDGH